MKPEWNDQKLVYAHLAQHCKTVGKTAGEIERDIERPGSHRRLSEMEKMGLAKRGPKRICSVTAKTRDTWLYDDSPAKPKLPKKPLVHENRVLQARVKHLEQEAAFLKGVFKQFSIETQERVMGEITPEDGAKLKRVLFT